MSKLVLVDKKGARRVVVAAIEAAPPSPGIQIKGVILPDGYHLLWFPKPGILAMELAPDAEDEDITMAQQIIHNLIT